jgi:hypothetical protein
MDKEKKEKVLVFRMLYQVEKEWLQILAEKSGRSMSSYLRFLLLEAIDN